MTDGQLNLDFQGENWACSVSAVVIFPVEKAAEGEKFLKYVEQQRRFYFDNYFKRILHRPTGDPLRPTRRGPEARLRRLPARPHAGRLLQRHAAAGRKIGPAAARARPSPASTSR